MAESRGDCGRTRGPLVHCTYRVGGRQHRYAVHNKVLVDELRSRAIEYDELDELLYLAITKSMRRTALQEARGHQKLPSLGGSRESTNAAE
jgi:hypothetical protein